MKNRGAGFAFIITALSSIGTAAIFGAILASIGVAYGDNFPDEFKHIFLSLLTLFSPFIISSFLAMLSPKLEESTWGMGIAILVIAVVLSNFTDNDWVAFLASTLTVYFFMLYVLSRSKKTSEKAEKEATQQKELADLRKKFDELKNSIAENENAHR